LAAGAMALSSVLVVSNALRLRRVGQQDAAAQMPASSVGADAAGKVDVAPSSSSSRKVV